MPSSRWLTRRSTSISTRPGCSRSRRTAGSAPSSRTGTRTSSIAGSGSNGSTRSRSRRGEVAMTTEALRAGGGTAPREDSAEAAVRAFFAAYLAHDVEGMVDLCADNAGFRYVPFEVWGRQRVLYGEGHVRTVGKVIWTALIDAFPDLANAVTSLRADGD